MSQQLWDHIMLTVGQIPIGLATGGDHSLGKPTIHISKMTSEDKSEMFLNLFEKSVWAAGWPEDHWAALLFPSLVRLAQQVVDTLTPEEVTKYGKV